MHVSSVSVYILLVCCSQFCSSQVSDCFGEGSPRSPRVDAIAKGADNFAMKLFTDIAQSDPHNSIVLSPYSIWSVLSTAYFGANTETERQLRSALGVPSKSDAFYGGKLIEAQLKLNRGTTINKVDKAYFDKDLSLRQCAIDKLVEIETVDFSDSKAAADKINRDVASFTENKIRNFLSPGIIANTRFVLLNAVYFKGLWTFPFVDGKTEPRPFYDETGKFNISTANMMTTQAKFRYVESPRLGASVLELPYENSNISMYIILPNLGEATVNSVLGRLSSDTLDEVTRNFQVRTVSVLLPRFKMTTRIAEELKKGLINLGIKDLFNAAAIDLTYFLPVDKVSVDHSIHHAIIEVTEEGTVATAVTALFGTRSGASKIVNFSANRPFIFLIRDVSQGLTLFIGVLRNPTHTSPI